MNIPHPENSKFQQVWNELAKSQLKFSGCKLNDLFTEDADRIKNFVFEFDGLHLDISKNFIDDFTFRKLLELAETTNLQARVRAMFNGERINTSENRPVLHTALRSPPNNNLELDNINIINDVQAELDKIGNFINKLHAGEIKGSTGKPINTFVNLGIGGSDLGPKMVVKALENFNQGKINVIFVSNIDPVALESVLTSADPDTTLFCIASKSFTTLETLHNACAAKAWLEAKHCQDFTKHFAAVSANQEAARAFGVNDAYSFKIWDWVGGRYSMWSAMGLPVAVTIGMDLFRKLLSGANKMDQHFLESPPEQNLPIILGLLDIWYRNFFHTQTLAVVPYSENLSGLPEYLGQLMMESNGKSICLENKKIDYPTCPIVWGGVGTNAQHAFFQLLHQGTHLIPLELLLSVESSGQNKLFHMQLLANGLAQGNALLEGNKADSEKSFMEIHGNKPSTTILIQKLDPCLLGSLLALYEHRTFVQGHIWNINSFDQWGVELGKQIATGVYQDLDRAEIQNQFDPSTNDLIKRCKLK